MTENRPHSRIRRQPKTAPFGDRPFQKVSLLSRDSHARSYVVRVGTAGKFAESHSTLQQRSQHKSVLKIFPIRGRRSDSMSPRNRSFAEYKLQKSLSLSIPGGCVSPVRDYALNPRASFIVKDFPKAGFLSDFLSDSHPFSEMEARFVCRQLLYIFCLLHESRVAFNDFRLSSFGVAEGFQIQLFDFSRAVRLNWDENRRKYRGPTYIPFEMIAKENVFAYREDTVCFGRVLYALLSGTELQMEEDGEFPNVDVGVVEECSVSEECRWLLKHCVLAPRADLENVWELIEMPWFREHQLDEISFDENGPRLKIPERFRDSSSDCEEEWLQLSYRGPWRQGEQSPYSKRFSFGMRECSAATHRRKMTIKEGRPTSGPGYSSGPTENVEGMWVDVSLDSPKFGLGFRLNTGIVGAHFNDVSSILYNPTRRFVRWFRIDGEIEEYYLTSRLRLDEMAHGVVKKIKLVRWFEKHFRRTWGRRDPSPQTVMDSRCLVWPPIPEFFK